MCAKRLCQSQEKGGTLKPESLKDNGTSTVFDLYVWHPMAHENLGPKMATNEADRFEIDSEWIQCSNSNRPLPFHNTMH